MIKILTQSPLHANILACDFGQLELIRSAGLAKIGIALAHRQVARTLLRVALSLAATAGETILTIAAAVAEFLTKVLRLNARAVRVAGMTRMVAGSVVVHVIRGRVLFQLNLSAMQRPQALLLLLLARRRKVLPQILETELGILLLGKLVYLTASLCEHVMRNCAIVLQINFV